MVAVSILHASAVGCAITEPVLQVSPRFSATGAPSLCRRILGMMCTSFCGSPQRSSSLCFWRTCSFQLEYCFLWCSLFWLACWLTSLFVTSTLGHFGLCAPQVSISCHAAAFRDFGVSFADHVELGLSPCLMDKYLWEHIQIHLVRDDLCACAWWHASTQRASGLVRAGQRLCRRWYTWYDGQPGTNRKTCRGSSGVWILEIWVSVTVAVCALLLSLGLVRGMFCKRHRWFEKLSVLSLGEAGEWMFRDFKKLLYGSFEASFLSMQAYLMSAMFTPEFVAFVNDVLCFPFPVTFTMAMCALVLVFMVLVRGMRCKHHLSLGEMVNPVLDDAGEWVSRVFKDQVYGVFQDVFP